MAKILATPGVYIEEKNAFPNSVVPVQTAVPAFLGYTEKAMLNNKDLTNVPTRISSFGEFLLYFGGAPQTTYTFMPSAKEGDNFSLSVAERRFLLFYSLKLFFANGGSDCYIVSVGNYETAKISKEDFDSEDVDKDTGEIKPKGIRTLLKEPEPTMLVIPDAVLMADANDCYALQVSMLKHCGEAMRNRFAILDVYNGFRERSNEINKDVIQIFREKIENNNLQWGAAYYPWMFTNITDSSDVSYQNIEKASLVAFCEALDAEVDKNLADNLINADKASLIKAEIQKLSAELTEEQATVLHQTLLVVSPLYKSVLEKIREQLNLLPPSAGMAGIYTMIDNTTGVAQSPANVAFNAAVRPAVNLTNDEQEDLNLPLDGKAINAIRLFPGQGVLVWGARTLDGNSQNWRYISVRRTVIFIEQSIKYACEPYVFESNTSTTWTTVKALATNFLTNVWKSGALAGASPDDAFSVDVGLGTTMTPVDILDGIMRITVKVAITHPAEFIALTIDQKMQQPS